MFLKPILRLLPALVPALAFAAGEPFRPAFHFTPARNWMNDPNGLVHFAGEYHLFFQCNPYGIGGANKSWGHAVSRDLVRWEELPIAIPAAAGIEIFSGSAVIDWRNTTGFQTGDEPPMVAIYTGHGAVQDQRLAFSNDRGRTWTNYPGNPVIDIGSRDFRDPKVFWHEESSAWVMVVALSVDRKIRIYSSPDLKSWTHRSDFGPAGALGGVWECPDLFPLPVENETTRKWVLTASVSGGAPAGGTGSQYFVGEFDGSTFVSDASSSAAQPLPPGTLISDFEREDYGGWTTTGAAFGSGPAAGTLPQQQPVTGYRGDRLVNSYLGGDDATGTLASPSFTITRPFLNFLIGGGNHPGRACVNLLVDGSVVRTATGDNDELLNWKHWDVSPYLGQQARIEIVDTIGGSWGHINVDHLLLADTPVPPNPGSALWTEFGPDNYAPVSWSDIPAADGRRLWLGWMVDLRYLNVPTTPWLGGMTLPRELILKRTSHGLRLTQKPVAELASLRRTHLTRDPGDIAEMNAWLAQNDLPRLFECALTLEAPASGNAILRIGNDTEHTLVTWDRAASEISVDRTRSGLTGFNDSFPGIYKAPIIDPQDRLHLHLLVDTASLEVFADGGLATLSTLVFPAASTKGLRFSGSPGVRVASFDLWELGSIHPSDPAGLLGRWDFNEETPGAHADSSGHANTMTAAGNPSPAIVPGVEGNAIEIRNSSGGSSLLTVPATPVLTPSSFTASFHFNPKTVDNRKLEQLGWRSPAGLAWGFEILADRKFNFYVFDSHAANDVQSAASLPFEAYDSSQGSGDNLDNHPLWHHAAASYDAATGDLTLYLDGVKSVKTNTGLAGAPRYGSIGIGIGGGLRLGGGTTIYDDLRIYNGVLTETEIDFLRRNPGLPLPAAPPPAPAPPKLDISRHGGSTFLTWPENTGLALWSSLTLDPAGWTKIPGSENLTTYATVTSSHDRIFFRLASP